MSISVLLRDPADFGARVKATRCARGLDQATLGAQLGEELVRSGYERAAYSRHAVGAWERGVNEPPQPVVLALCRVLVASSDVLNGLRPFEIVAADGDDLADPATFGERLQLTRGCRCIDQIQLGELVGAELIRQGRREPARGAYSKHTVGAWERDRVEPPLHVVTALCRVLVASSDVLYGLGPFQVAPLPVSYAGGRGARPQSSSRVTP